MLYQVEWVPSEAIMALAKKRGMPEGEDCVLDYAEEADAAQHGCVEDFEAAVRLAKDKLNGDFFGQTRIEKLVYIRSRYGDRYDAEATWYVDHDSNPVEGSPDATFEIDLILDEHIVAR